MGHPVSPSGVAPDIMGQLGFLLLLLLLLTSSTTPGQATEQEIKVLSLSFRHLVIFVATFIQFETFEFLGDPFGRNWHFKPETLLKG